MAISLSNHEDRIKKLEDNSLSSSKLTEISVGNVSSYNLSNMSNNALHLISFTAAWTESYYNGRNVECCIPWLKNSYIAGLDCMGGSDFGYGAYVRIAENIISVIPRNGSNGRIEGMRIITLKLYYNFSYNIYRLANSISFHFFKCLINSFKGGVKEIWQLV